MKKAKKYGLLSNVAIVFMLAIVVVGAFSGGFMRCRKKKKPMRRYTKARAKKEKSVL